MEKDEQFIKDMESKYIPMIERMMISEKEHLKKLRKWKKEGNSKVTRTMLNYSKNNYLHCKQRLQEYKDYVVKLKGIE